VAELGVHDAGLGPELERGDGVRLLAFVTVRLPLPPAAAFGLQSSLLRSVPEGCCPLMKRLVPRAAGVVEKEETETSETSAAAG